MREQGDAGVRFKWRSGGRDQDKLLEEGLSYISVAPSPLSQDASAKNLRMELMEMFDMDQMLSGLHQRGRTKANAAR